MIALGLFMMLAPAGVGGYVGWQLRNVVVRLRIGEFTWTGHLYALLILGALLACWFMLGAAFVQCRIAERRRREVVESAAAPRRPRSMRAPSGVVS